MSAPWRTISSREVYRNQWLRVREDRIERPISGPGLYSVVERLPSLTIVPRDADGSIYLVRQYRYPVDAYSWEIPAGTAEPDEALIDGARRELVEETGISAAAWTPLGSFWDAPGFCNQISHTFLAEDLTLGARALESTEEDLIVARFTLAETENMVRASEIRDGFTLSALLLLRLHTERRG